jgi:sortase A
VAPAEDRVESHEQLAFELKAAKRRAALRTWLPLTLGGIVLIAIGLSLGGIAGYQVWGTSLEAGRAQDDLAADFGRRRADVETTATDGATTTTVSEVTAEPAVSPPQRDETAELPSFDNPVIVADFEPTQVTLPEVPETITLRAEPTPAMGEAVGRIVIEEIAVDWFVGEGIEPWDLSRGPGHGPWSPLPGQPGNSVISGHRTTYGAPFNRLDELEAGDRITIETLIGIHTYEVVGIAIVEPDDVWTVDHMDGAWLTLTTCHPEFWSYERLVVFSKLVDGPNAAAIGELFPADYEMPVEPGTITPPPGPTTE